MYKVVLADDEAISLDGLRTLTDWDQLGFQVCGACDNGEDAMAHIISSRPELVVTDIRMPGMDGLELIRNVRSLNIRQPVFIILSGYADFEYARTALGYDVKHYLLKPVLDSDWEEMLHGVHRHLKTEAQKELRQSQLSSQALSLTLMKLLKGEWSEQDPFLMQQALQLDAAVHGWQYVHLKGLQLEDREKCRKLSTDENLIYVELDDHQAGIAVNGSRSAMKVAQLFYSQLQQPEPHEMVISVGPRVRSVRELRISYQQAADAAYPCLTGEPSLGLVDCQTIGATPRQYKLPCSQLIHKLLTAVERLQDKQVNSRLSILFQELHHQQASPDMIRLTALHIVMETNKLIKEIDESIDIQEETENFMKHEPRSISDLQNSLQSYLGLCMEYIRSRKNKESEHPIANVEHFLRENYHRPITVKDIAEQFFINPVYLGHSFIKKYGVTILEFVHDLRIAEARQRLTDSKDAVRLIAENVGYMHYHHFLREFEKRTGVKPVEYRKRQQKLNALLEE
ncbi:response regulator [Paenibacillus sp. JX-17]|uniref:Response regulator n=1 Tax=Paenibacillus lacisoli TaxID=3064525 RepID=A0ABT9CMA0_9BACL|nr:response regulator [Paenibacillus sp. JX-17]MDO7908771.1 response regulator [Paenibacillus sp. JX-17]